MKPLKRSPFPALLMTLALTGLVGAGCSDLATDSPLANARTSPETLAEAALAALEAGAEDALQGLMITREEYEELLWPVLPDRYQVPFDFVWSVTGPRSRKARRGALNEYQGLTLRLDRVELGTDVEAYDEFTIYRRSRMWVTRGDTGATGVLPLMDTLVEMEGGWKFMNFIDDA